MDKALQTMIDNMPDKTGKSLDEWRLILRQKSFSNHLGELGDYVLIFSVATFTLSTMFGYSYYGCKCASYLFGASSKFYYRIFKIQLWSSFKPKFDKLPPTSANFDLYS